MSKDEEKVCYIGDGVYAYFEGYYIRLETEREEGRKHIIYIEDVVLSALNDFAAMCWGWKKEK